MRYPVLIEHEKPDLSRIRLTCVHEQEAKASKGSANAAHEKLAAAEALNTSLSQQVCLPVLYRMLLNAPNPLDKGEI